MAKKSIDIDISNYPDVEFLSKDFISSKDINTIIIKGHILIEHKLNEFINANSLDNNKIEKLNFRFNDKIEIAGILGLYKNDKNLHKQLKLLNSLRNHIAHKLKYNPNELSMFLSSLNIPGINSFIKNPKNFEAIFKRNNIDIAKLPNEHFLFFTCIVFIYLNINTISTELQFKKTNKDIKNQTEKNNQL